jgi:hypothetical protein
MSEFIQRNKLMIHIAAEITFGCLLVLYVLRSNKSLYTRIIYLEDKLSQFEKTLQEQDQLIQSLLRNNRKVDSVPPTSLPTLSPISQSPPTAKPKRLRPPQPKPTPAPIQMIPSSIPSSTPSSIPSPRPSPPPPTPSSTSRSRYQPTLETIPEEDEYMDQDIEVLETEEVYEENMDEEIENELQKLNLKK